MIVMMITMMLMLLLVTGIVDHGDDFDARGRAAIHFYRNKITIWNQPCLGSMLSLISSSHRVQQAAKSD